MIVGIQNEILKIHSLGLLKKLLEDKTTRANIIWATDAYKDRGIKYERDQEIKVDLVIGINSDVIKNRARKEMSIRRRERDNMQRCSHHSGYVR